MLSDGPISGQVAGLGQSVSAPVSLPTALPANHGCIVQVSLSSPRPQAEHPGSSQLPPLGGQTEEDEGVIEDGACQGRAVGSGCSQRQSKEMKQRTLGKPGKIPRGGGGRTRQGSLGSERQDQSQKRGLTSRASLSPGERSGALPSLSKHSYPHHQGAALSSGALWRFGQVGGDLTGSLSPAAARWPGD